MNCANCQNEILTCGTRELSNPATKHLNSCEQCQQFVKDVVAFGQIDFAEVPPAELDRIIVRSAACRTENTHSTKKVMLRKPKPVMLLAAAAVLLAAFVVAPVVLHENQQSAAAEDSWDDAEFEQRLTETSIMLDSLGVYTVSQETEAVDYEDNQYKPSLQDEMIKLEADIVWFEST